MSQEKDNQCGRETREFQYFRSDPKTIEAVTFLVTARCDRRAMTSGSGGSGNCVFC